jgi:SNF2 family DNA or RNA helicase
VKALKDPNVHYYIVHWNVLRLMPELRQVQWFHVIADEVHRAKNRKAQVTKSLKLIRAARKTALSGTPADDKPEDLWSIINWLWPKYYTSYWKFIRRHCLYEDAKTHEGGQTYRKFLGVANVDELHREMAPWYIRRLKEDVLEDLPDKYYSDRWVTLDPKQRSAYEKMKKDMIAWVEGHSGEEVPLVAPVVIAQLTRLQQFAVAYMQPGENDKFMMSEPSAKLDSLMDLIEDNDDQQLVVFSQFKSILTLFARRLDKRKISYGLYTGDTKNRHLIVDDFQKGNRQIFAGTIAAGGEGITLTAASTMIFLDRSWKPTMNRQAEDREHRIGQTNGVHIIDLMARDTVDLGRRQRLEQKWDFIKAILGDK